MMMLAVNLAHCVNRIVELKIWSMQMAMCIYSDEDISGAEHVLIEHVLLPLDHHVEFSKIPWIMEFSKMLL